MTSKILLQAARIVILAREYLDSGRVNVDTIDDMTIEMEMTSVMTTQILGDTGYTKTELEQVLLVISLHKHDFCDFLSHVFLCVVSDARRYHGRL